MISMDTFSDIPDWGSQFVDSIHQYLLQLSGQSKDTEFIEYSLHNTFILAQNRLEGLSREQIQKTLTIEWLRQIAEEAFIRHLLHQLSAGPSLYFELVYSTFQQRMRRRIAALLQKSENDPDVEDCVQDTFMKVFHILEVRAKQGVPMPVYPLIGWLYSVARSVCHDYWEKQKQRNATFSLEEQTTLVEQESEDEREQPDIHAEIKEREEKVRACVERLPEPCRTCIKLFYYNDLSLAQIADHLKLSTGKVKTCIYQLAVRHFRKLWYEENYE